MSRTHFNRELLDNAELFPDSYTRYGPIQFIPPEGLHRVQARSGHADTQLRQSSESWGKPEAGGTALLASGPTTLGRPSRLNRNRARTVHPAGWKA